MIGIRSRRHSGKPPSTAGRLGLSLFFLFFLGMGSLFETFILREFGRAMGQRGWHKMPCRIVASEVKETDDSESPYAFVVGYQYEYSGRTYDGSTYQRGYSGSDGYFKTHRLAQEYPVGLSTFCYVNAANPGEAVLKRDSLLIGLAILFPMIFVLIGAGGLYFVWRKQLPEEARPIASVAIATTRHRGLGRFGLAAFFGIFAIAGGAMLYPLGIRPIARTIDAQSWVETPCKVLRAEVRDHDSDDGTTYSVYILYQYEFGGRTYKSDRYDFIGGSSSGYDGKARVVAMYESAARPVCYVNPRNPVEAVLKRGFHAKLLFALFPLPFLLVGVGGIVGSLRSKRPATEGAAMGRIGRIGPIGPVKQTAAGPVVLTPKCSAKAKFIGIVIFAAIWNGIVSIFVVNAIGGLLHGGWSLIGLLFVLPFVAVGIGLIGGAVYLFLAMFNPRPRLELSSGAIPLGGAAELRWSLSGQTSRISEFTVTLRGVEEARYRRGTNTCTDKNTFYEMELYRTSDAYEIASGRVGFVMPQDTMHSFEADNNKVLWDLEVHGVIKGWPDVKESFKINVMPSGEIARTS